MKSSLLQEIKNRGISIGTILSARMVEPMLAMDFLRMRVLLDETVQLEQDIFYTFVLDKEGRPLIHTFDRGFPTALKHLNSVSDDHNGSMKLLDTGDKLFYDYALPVAIDTHRLGTLRLGLLRTRAEKAVAKIMVSAVVSIVFTIFIAGIVGTILLNPITKSIKKLHESSEQALRGNLDVKTAPMLGKNCWDIMNCHKNQCPAYKNYHHRCWYMAGTLCPTCVEGEYAKKIDSCRQCQVYRKCSGDEIQSLAESFDAMTLSLKGNLSSLKDAEAVLNEQKARLQTILDAIPDFISLQDDKGRYISVNKAFCDMLNKEKEDIVGKFNDDLFPPGLTRQYNKEDRQLFTSGLPLIKENKIMDEKGISWLHVVKIAVMDGSDKVAGLVCSGRDITQLKAVQEQLTHAQKMESVGRLAAGVAHEINTPLGIILGYAQILLEDVEQEGQIHDDVATIVKQTRICSRIVADLLSFSRSRENIISEFDMNGAIDEVLDVVVHTFGLHHVDIHRSYYPGPLKIRGDKEKLKQVCINLLNNAFDAIEQDGVISIHTDLEATAREITISISDTGHGISRENIVKIFEPFYTTKGPDKGTGLGLSVTFGIIKEHNGSIDVFSPPLSFLETGTHGQGTQFVVTLPTGLD
ncbi:ATP-binding protein [Desulfocicer vacuolatum]|nr:ATP-binding protein [Desulfocicer vacuolatum]